jgi:hypothetical protein
MTYIGAGMLMFAILAAIACLVLKSYDSKITEYTITTLLCLIFTAFCITGIYLMEEL